MASEQDQILDGLTKITSMLINEVTELKQSNSALQAQVKDQNDLVLSLLNNQKALVDALDKTKIENKKLAETMIRSVNNVPYELGISSEGILPVPKIATFEETVDKLISSNASIARYGDGEFSLMDGYCRQGFQHYDERLAEKLRNVFNSNDEGFLVAIADNYGSLYKYDEECRNQVRYFMTDKTRREHNKFIDMDRLYYNAHMTSAYQMSHSEDEYKVKNLYKKLKSIWSDKNVIIIEGRLSRIGVGNDLLNSAASIKRILCPPEHAFDKYDEILNTAIQYGNRTDNAIFLIFLGPTATVLSYDIYKEGFRALDLGHIDIDYEQYIRGSKDPAAIKGKHINNLNLIDDIEDVDDPDYLSQIVCTIK